MMKTEVQLMKTTWFVKLYKTFLKSYPLTALSSITLVWRPDIYTSADTNQLQTRIPKFCETFPPWGQNENNALLHPLSLLHRSSRALYLIYTTERSRISNRLFRMSTGRAAKLTSWGAACWCGHVCVAIGNRTVRNPGCRHGLFIAWRGRAPAVLDHFRVWRGSSRWYWFFMVEDCWAILQWRDTETVEDHVLFSMH